MLPCCMAGAFFIIQFMGIYRWFCRKVLKKDMGNEEDYWHPTKVKFKDKLKTMLSDPRKRRAFIVMIAFETIVLLVVSYSGGFEVISKSIKLISDNPNASVSYIWECCFNS
jgi:hypothetical protein